MRQMESLRLIAAVPLALVISRPSALSRSKRSTRLSRRSNELRASVFSENVGTRKTRVPSSLSAYMSPAVGV